MKSKHIPRKTTDAAFERESEPMDNRPLRPAADQKLDSEAIARAVYDGMRDLRVKKPG